MYNSAKALLKGIKAEFSTLMQNSPESTFGPLINNVKSNSDKENYWIPESLPNIKEWIDQRHFTDMTDEKLTVYNKDWDNGIRVDRFTLDDSREYLGGNLENWIKMLVNNYKDFPDELCQSLLAANSNAFDGTAMFSTSRANLDTGSNTINNLLTGTSSSTYSLSEFETDFKAAKTKLLGFRDKHNRAFNKNAKLAVFVPQHMEDVAKVLLADRQELIYVSSVQSNLYAGDAQVIVNWEQSTTTDNDWYNDWYLVNLNADFKPFVIQDREGVKWEFWDDTKNKYIDYGFYFRMGYNFLNPMSVVKTNN
jgi:phage major head subunit gpT-like protein